MRSGRLHVTWHTMRGVAELWPFYQNCCITMTPKGLVVSIDTLHRLG